MLTTRLSKLIVALICAASFASAVFAQDAPSRAATGRLVEIRIAAPALKANLLGDPAEQSIAIYLPPSYDTSTTKRFPTLYLLHGFLGHYRAWTSNGYQGMSLQPLMDELIKSGKIREMIVVAPNGGNAYSGAFYTNSSVTGNWEDYIYRELVQNVDAHYRTIARPESRGIAGHSMGGYGAVVLAMKHPDVFSAVYALSPCCLGLQGDLSSENPVWLKAIHLKSREELKTKPETIDDFYTLVFVALSAAFSPNPHSAPLFVDFPYVERDGRLEENAKAMASWRSKMPLYMVEENKNNLLKLRGIFIDYGQKEEFPAIRSTSQLFSKALAERNIPHTFEVYADGDHSSKIRSRMETRVFQFFSDKLDFSNPR
ncbi:MAG: Esterase AS-Trib27 [Acidobacteria bacterium]|nr:Esterase AS-Trib27 [Acidobacteriota bacterium]